MKNVFFCFVTAALLACNASGPSEAGQVESQVTGTALVNEQAVAGYETAPATTIEWLDPVVQDLGTIKKGQVAEITWKFKNTGTKPLLITDVRAGCGCTTPDVPKEPIAPGAESLIRAKFNSENFSGHVTKEVYVQANNSNRNNGHDNKLTFTADIK